MEGYSGEIQQWRGWSISVVDQLNPLEGQLAINPKSSWFILMSIVNVESSVVSYDTMNCDLKKLIRKKRNIENYVNPKRGVCNNPPNGTSQL